MYMTENIEVKKGEIEWRTKNIHSVNFLMR